MISELEIVARLLAAAVFGGIIGYEREISNRPAGLRTHVLVTIGAALVMMVSKYGFSEMGFVNEPSRMAAQVVSGIGFLGAGTIITQGNSVHGLTTAASLWTSACVGLAIVAGYYLGGAVVGIIVIITLVLLRRFENNFLRRKFQTSHVFADERLGLMIDINKTFEEMNITVVKFDITNKQIGKHNYIHIMYDIKASKQIDLKAVADEIAKHENVVDAYWETIIKV